MHIAIIMGGGGDVFQLHHPKLTLGASVAELKGCRSYINIEKGSNLFTSTSLLYFYVWVS